MSRVMLQRFLQNRRSTTFLAPKALQQLQRRSEMSERTLCIFSKDVPERPTALKVLKMLKNRKAYFRAEDGEYVLLIENVKLKASQL